MKGIFHHTSKQPILVLCHLVSWSWDKASTYVRYQASLCDTVCLVVWKLQAVTSLSLWVSATSNDATLASHKIFGQSCEILSFSSPPPEQCFLTPSSGLDAHWDFTQVWRRGTCELSRNRRTKLVKFEHGLISLGLSNWKENPKRRWDQQCLTLFGQFGL